MFNNDISIWRRISFNNTQALAMKLYDTGETGFTYNSIIWTFVPRLIYPDKPLLTHGEKFVKIVYGEYDPGGISPGFFGEAYWNFGWIGVFYSSIIISTFLVFFNIMTIRVLILKNYQYFLLIMPSYRLSYSMDGWLIATSINSIPFWIIYFTIIIFLTKIYLIYKRYKV